MKVWDEPMVILVARPAIDWEGVRDLLELYGLEPADWRHDGLDGDLLPELMGRLCYGSFGPAQGRVGSMEYLGNIVKQGHGSVLEHACWSFTVCGASRGYQLQQVRHRAGFAYSAESTHFIRYGDGGRKGEVEPEVSVCGLGGVAGTALDELKRSIAGYSALWDILRKIDPDAKKKEVSGAARGLLPTALVGKLGFSANARALRHLCEYRCNPDNVLEIRLVAAQVLKIMRREAPASFQDLALFEDVDGLPTIGSTVQPPERREVVDMETGAKVTVFVGGPKV